MVENLQRKDLNPLEKAASFEIYLDQYGCTQEELAGRLHVDRSTIANLIRLLELPTGVQDAIRTRCHFARARPGAAALGRRSPAAATMPADSNRFAFSPGDRRDRADHDPRGRCIPRRARPHCRPNAPRAGRGRQTAALEQELRTALGTKVDVRSSASGKGKIVIHFANADEFERLRDHLTDQPVRSQVG